MKIIQYMDLFVVLYGCELEENSLKTQFARIHTSSLINIEKILNRPITKFYNGDDVNVIEAELGLTKTRPTCFDKRYNFL